MQGLETPEPVADESVDAWARTAMAQLGTQPGVHRVGLALTEGGGRRLRFTASDRHGAGDTGTADGWCHVDAYDDVPLNTAVRTGDVVLGSLDELAPRYADFVDRLRTGATTALAAVPLSAAGQMLGGAVLFYDEPQAFDLEQRAALGRVVVELGSALRQAQRRRPRSTAFEHPPVAGDVLVAVHDVPAEHAAVADARRFLVGTLQAWEVDADAVDDAVLCLSELVTNALLHAGAGCSVRALLENRVLTVAVRDGGTGGGTSVRPGEDPMTVHGRGLSIVEALAARWGSEPDAFGLTVWFSLELAPRE